MGDSLTRRLAQGDATALESSVHCIHRLKTGFPARCLAQMGAIYGGGTDAEIDAIGRFFEATGLAFQIIDDVLNLRGLMKPGATAMSQALKVVGEDIMEGKVTAPIAKAMGLLKSEKERKALWDVVRSKTKDQKIIDDCIAQLDCQVRRRSRHEWPSVPAPLTGLVVRRSACRATIAAPAPTARRARTATPSRPA
jgi:geranylgeranyl pyrophosphate synthase